MIDPEEKIEKLIKDFKEHTKTEIPDHVMMIWKKKQRNIKFKLPCKNIITKKNINNKFRI